MTIQMFKELLNGKYDAVSPPTLLPTGSIVDGKNMRKVGPAGGWKVRKGMLKHHSTALESGATIDSLHAYTHPRNIDRHFLAQVNSKIYDAKVFPVDPPTVEATFSDGGTDLGVTTGTTPAFSDIVKELLFFADGEGVPFSWGGDSPYCSGFFSYIGDDAVYNDYWRKVTDGRTGTYATLHDHADDVLYICSPEPADKISLVFGTPNLQKSVLTVNAWTSGSWSTVGAADGTDDGKAIEGITKANPGVMTMVAHGLDTADTILVSGITQTDWTALNATLTITKIDADTFSIAVDTSAYTDVYDAGTDPGVINASFGIDGDITWTEPGSTESQRVIEGIMGYWYQLVWDVALMPSVTVTSCKVHYDMTRMTNKWNGVYEWCGACRFFDQSALIYEQHTQNVTNESTSVYMDVGLMQALDFIYVKAAEPATGIGIGVVAEYENVTATAQITLAGGDIEYWNGLAWVSVGAIIDGTVVNTASFGQTGTIWWNLPDQADERRTFAWDSIPGFWYRIAINVNSATAEIRIWGVNYAPLPEPLATTDGVIEFKGRLFTWGDPEYPNRLRFSAKDYPDCFSGTDSGYTEQMGDMDKILCVRKFYNELMVWKRNEVYLLEGYSPESFGALRVSTTVGLASPQTAWVVETGHPTMHKQEPLSVAIWQDSDGVYILDGRKPRKVSEAVDNLFNPDYGSPVAEAELQNRQAFLDKNNNEYHLILSSSELVYNYLTDEFYPVWDRASDLTCGLLFKDAYGRSRTYGGDAAGFVHQLEIGVIDNTGNNITSSIKTRAISAQQDKSTTLKLTSRSIWLEAKALDVASVIATKIFPDVADSGTTITAPAVIDLNNVGYAVTVPKIDTSVENISCFQLEWTDVGHDFQLYSFLYQVDARGDLASVV